MVDLIHGLEGRRVAENLARIQAEIGQVGRDPKDIEVLAATKYLPADELSALAEGGVRLVGENRAQDLVAKAEAHPGTFTWDFIGHLQSRKIKTVLPYVRYIHSVASDSALEQLRRHASAETEVLVEVNVAGDPGKSGLSSADLPTFLERCPVRVVGLMTMPPLTSRPEDSRPHFATLRELAQEHGLPHLSMGTSQDYLVAVQEGATILRLGSILYS